VLVQLEGAAAVLMPTEALVLQDDGSYHMTLDAAVFERRPHTDGEPSGLPLVLPVIQEQLDIQMRPVETGRIRIRKIVHDREEVVDPPLLGDEVVIERVPINRVVEGPISVRTRGTR
jgi:stress response protein YsnF